MVPYKSNDLNYNIWMKINLFSFNQFHLFCRSGNVLVVDFGRILIKSDLQPSNNQLEDATCMELEERLYDRFHADCSNIQVFIFKLF